MKPPVHLLMSVPAFPAMALALLLAACATADPDYTPTRLPTEAEVEQYNANVPEEEQITCRTETPVGSNIPRRVCRYTRDIQDTSTFHREQLRRAL